MQINPFERDTDILQKQQIRNQVVELHDIALLMSQAKWQDALKILQQLNISNINTQQALKYEIQLMQLFCCQKLNTINEKKNINKLTNLLQKLNPFELNQTQSKRASSINLSKNISMNSTDKTKIFQLGVMSIKFHTFLAQLIINSKIQYEQSDLINRLAYLLQKKQFQQNRYELFTSLTGCRYPQNIKQMKITNKQITFKNAKKIQILANWKYMFGFTNQYQQFKKQALNAWSSLNYRNEFLKCEKQLQQILSNQQTNYTKIMKKTRSIVTELFKIKFSKNQQQDKQNIVKIILPNLIKEIQPIQTLQKSKYSKASQIFQSRLKKQMHKKTKLIQIINNCELFKKQIMSQKNEDLVSFISNSKFLDQNIIIVRRLFTVFSKLKNFDKKYAFYMIKKRWNDLQKKYFNENQKFKSKFK